MCDTLVALGNSTKDGSVIFGKNSDRKFNEPQLITYAPRKRHTKGEELTCTHISIPQISETNAVLLSQPWWIWGAEMGANEYGVVIGNESIFTKEPLKEIGLLGMDLVRLGLERGKSAKEALDTIIDLLEKYGQGGIHINPGINYHNSMIITDSEEAFVIEIAGEWWVVDIVENFRSISNDISIRGKGDFRREGIIQHAIEAGYCKDDDDFDFAFTFSSPRAMPSYTECTMRQLKENKNEITPALMMEFLREHEGGICRHRMSDITAGSMVSHLHKEIEKSIHWFTGSMLPCLSVFKPYNFPIEAQRVIEAKKYTEINPDWFWTKHAEFIKPFVKRPTRKNLDRDDYIKKLRPVEEDLIAKVDNLVLKGNEISSKDFKLKIISLNEEAWKKSLELIT